MWIIIKLPEPSRAVIVHADADVMNEFAGISASGFEKAIERNAIGPIQLMTPHHVRVLLAGVQTDVEDGVSLDAVITADLVSDSELYCFTGIPEQIEEGLQVCP